MFGNILSALALVVAWGAPAGEPDPNCLDDRGVNRCSGEVQAETRELFGVRSIEEHEAAGDEVRRVFFVDGYGRDLVAIAFVRARGRDPTLFVHHARPESGERPEPFQASVPLPVWTEIIDRSRHFQRSFVPDEPAADGTIMLCFHSWVYTIEASGSRSGGVRRKVEDACEKGPGAIFAGDVEAAALSLLPHCDALDPELHRRPSSQLNACRFLSGDRFTAAEAMNRSQGFHHLSAGDAAVALDGLFGLGGEAQWGDRRAVGQRDAIALWEEEIARSDRPVFLSREVVEGLSADEARLVGMLNRAVDRPDGGYDYEQAAIELLWKRNYAGGRLQVSRATVGPWELVPQARR